MNIIMYNIAYGSHPTTKSDTFSVCVTDRDDNVIHGEEKQCS